MISMLDLHERIQPLQGRKRPFIEMPDTVSGISPCRPVPPDGRDPYG
jgi:hypothetical protein